MAFSKFSLDILGPQCRRLFRDFLVTLGLGRTDSFSHAGEIPHQEQTTPLPIDPVRDMVFGFFFHSFAHLFEDP